MGIEPTYPAWKAGVLPLNYTRYSSCTWEYVGAQPWCIQTAEDMFQERSVVTNIGLSPSGKAQDFDSCIRCQRIPVP